MPLDPSQLRTGLRNQWLPGDQGPYAGSAMESGQRFADVVAPWFALAVAGGFPCATAMARKAQLTAGAGAALAANDAMAAGQQLAMAVAQYMAAQSFGAGMSAMPVAASAMVSAFGQVFSSHDLDADARATTMANAMYAAAVSTIVTFPPTLPPAPIT